VTDGNNIDHQQQAPTTMMTMTRTDMAFACKYAGHKVIGISGSSVPCTDESGEGGKDKMGQDVADVQTIMRMIHLGDNAHIVFEILSRLSNRSERASRCWDGPRVLEERIGQEPLQAIKDKDRQNFMMIGRLTTNGPSANAPICHGRANEDQIPGPPHGTGVVDSQQVLLQLFLVIIVFGSYFR
jgi:hypothetical protein